ncbi:MAG: amino acid ABC transporter substrate-binding protein [Clostridia bacterium]|nr:MAG: amino acid ABC transporter substrate-binding protein [Clostridia bacterium]
MKRRLLIWVAVLAVSLVLIGVAGCGQGTSTGEGAKQEGAGQGSVEQGGAKTGGAEPIVFGAPVGLGSQEGRNSLQAVELAVEEINARGGISVGGTKRPIKLVSIDDRGAEPGIPVHDSLAAVEKLIVENKPNAIVAGIFRSEVLLAGMDLIAKYKIPFITTMPMTPQFEKKLQTDREKYKYLFRASVNSLHHAGYILKGLEFIGKEFGFNKIYIMHEDLLWATAASDAIEKWAKDNGWEVVGRDAYPSGSSDFSSSLTKAKSGQAQVIAVTFDMPQTGILIKQVKTMQIPAVTIGYVSPATAENAWDVFGEDIEGLINLVPEIGPIPIQAVPKSVEFNKNFGIKYGEEARRKMVGHSPGPSYDSVYIMADAIERAGSLDPDAIVTALEQTDMEGVVGRIKFNEDHQVPYGFDPKETAIGALFQWQSGKRVPVFPEAISEGKIALPSYMQK